MNTLHANIRFDETAGVYEVYDRHGDWIAAFDTIAQAIAFMHDNAGEEGVHEFDSTGDAYDACQCDEDIKTGDTLVIRDSAYYGPVSGRDEDGFRVYESNEPTRLEVVGLAWAWPLAVTVAAGELHAIEPDTGAYARVLADAGITAAQVRAAIDKADQMGLPVRMLFRAWLANAEAAADAAINDANLVATVMNPTPALETAEVDLSDHPFSDENIAYESGADDTSDVAWFAFCAAVERELGIEDLDGNQVTDGYSLDHAHDCWMAGDSPAETAAIFRDCAFEILRRRAWSDARAVATAYRRAPDSTERS